MKHPMTRVEEQDDNARFGTDTDTSPEAAEWYEARQRLDRAFNTPTLALREIREWKARAEAAEEERDALKVELAQAKITLLAIAKGDVPSSRRLPQWHDKYQDLRGEARAFLARHQKGQTDD